MFLSTIPQHVPTNYPTNMSGTLTYKIVQKKDYVRKDGTCALYIQLFLSGKRKRLPLNIFVSPQLFDDRKQLIKGKTQLANDYNLIIRKKLGDINSIVVNYRLAGTYLTLDRLIDDLLNPTSKTDFLKFWEEELQKQEGLLSSGTYKQQYSTLRKLKGFKSRILFQDINEDLVNELIVYCRKKLKNKETTINTTLKNFKKFLHLANKKGIRTHLTFDEITTRSFRGDRTFLSEEEIKLLYKYYNSEFINETNKNILDRFLFACFTGLRISDIQKLTHDNFIGDFLAFKSEKTGKFQKIKLNETAKKFIHKEKVFLGNYADAYINRQLKFIARVVKLNKKVTFHVSRHTFATNYLIKGGRVENLQKVLGHSNIRETMIYVHIVDAIMNEEINFLDTIL